MVSSRVWFILNVSLFFVTMLLLLNIFGVSVPSLGKGWYYRGDPLCVVRWNGYADQWDDLNACCLYARQQLQCADAELEYNSQPLTKVCRTGTGKVVEYWLNAKAYAYCRGQPIWRS